ncbi:helix-turn-helix transcriptional regulator [Halohasta salina]|uniref:helix-turn-helix transcriptional regulator n=1 Tax=Halohasta salina TaxID=2961621 RepID=UPI003CCD072B
MADGGVQWYDLSGFQLNLLREIVDSEKPSGQTIRRNLEARTGDRINHGRLYPNLDELVDHQLVEKGEQDRRTNYYEVTDAGRRLAEQIADDFDHATTQPLAAATDGGSTDE